MRDERSMFAPGLPPVAPPSPDLPAAETARDLVPASKPGLAPRRRSVRIAGTSFPAAVLRALEQERERGVLFLLMPLLSGSGAAAYYALSFEPDLSALLAGLAAMAVLYRLASARDALRLVLAGMALTIGGMTVAKLEVLRGPAEIAGSAVSTRLAGRIVEAEPLASGRVRLVIATTGSARPRLSHLPATVRITAPARVATARAGDRFSGRVRLLPPPGPVRPGGYDYSFESYFDGYGATGFVLGTPRIQTAGEGIGLAERVERLRHALAERIRQRIGGQEGVIAAALVTGFKGEIDPAAAEDLRLSGLAHILSISGLHMALVAGTMAGGLRALFAVFPVFSARHPVRKFSAWAALLAVTAYLLVSGGAIATRRSYVMLAVMLLALSLDRAALTMRNIAIAALLILCWSPHEIAGPGFQMSFAATAALVAAYNTLQQARGGRRHRLSGGMAGRFAGAVSGLLFTSLVAGSATGLYAAYHFQRFAPLGTVANLLAMPVVSLLVMPSALVAHLLIPFGLDGPVFRLMGVGVHAVMSIAHGIATWSGDGETGTVPRSAMILASLGLAAATILTTRLRLLSVPLAVAALVLLRAGDLPDGWISEDGKTIAVRTESGALAFNRKRISGFLKENWGRAAGTQEITRAATVPAKTFLRALARLDDAGAGRFACTRRSCFIRTADTMIVQTDDRAIAERACGRAALVVYRRATDRPACPEASPTRLLTLRDLAIRGAASFRLPSPGATDVILRHAVSKPYRPWHQYRTWSRAARGLKTRSPTKRVKGKPARKTQGQAPVWKRYKLDH
ncbi:ComEC/Rec2 family competence protein [Zhengella mangrovi]|uniref:ComEC/Rec2 family competence protein n=1 Tax=Zhengella mangrovi TaxID=1982044 RepID=UPI001056034E|nr:ComEC/Rec2 family competence protein [Zhengella mangrovi]